MKNLSKYINEYLDKNKIDQTTLQRRAERADKSITGFVYVELEMDKIMSMREANLIEGKRFHEMIESVLSEYRLIDGVDCEDLMMC